MFPLDLGAEFQALQPISIGIGMNHRSRIRPSRANSADAELNGGRLLRGGSGRKLVLRTDRNRPARKLG